MEMFLAWF